MDIGSTAAVENHDFKSIVEPNMERMIFDFLIESLESHYSNLKSKDHYLNIVNDTKQVTSLSEYNQRNIAQLHLDESQILEKNLQYLQRARNEVIKLFWLCLKLL